MMENENGNRLYTTGEIALTMGIVVLIILIPVVIGAIYYFIWL